MSAVSTIVFCGGGSIGHLAPSLAVAEKLPEGVSPLFVCSSTSEERMMVTAGGYRCKTIVAPKFPRGVSVWWILFPILFPIGLIQSLILLLREKPRAIFSKGGYVSVPVSLAGWMLRIPIVLHESDSVMGLGNKLIGILARKICRGFPIGKAHSKKLIHTGNPVRSIMATGNTEKAKHITGFSGDRPVLLIIGGSQGAEAINKAVTASLDSFLVHCDVIHLYGHGKTHADQRSGYWSTAFARGELPHLFALADIIITRAGAGLLSEISGANKPAIVIPLRGIAQDHQYKNAKVLAEARAIVHLAQRKISALPQVVLNLLEHEERRKQLAAGLHSFFPSDASQRLADVLLGSM